MFSIKIFSEEISRKRSVLSSEMKNCEWRKYAQVLDEKHTGMQAELTMMKERVWNSKKFGPGILLYSSSYLKEHSYSDSHKDFPSNEKSIELAKLIECYWSTLEAELLRDNVAVIIPEYISMDELFKFHLRYAQKCYKWGELVISDNEDVAFEAFKKASELFDKSMGMVWCKISVDKQTKLLSTRNRSGRKGGIKKSEMYRPIQEKLVELIIDLAPEEGWRSKAAAVNVLIEPLWLFIEESKLNVNKQDKKYRMPTTSQEALADTILKSWSTNIESVRQAFEDTVSRKKRTSQW
ncbi:TPA: hypothetical protein ACXI3L_000965 [Serratia marcescens]|nr:hypothetical protein [Serratia marcescens]HEJ8032750.1 hypothetical protein [Serratia marcescens]